MALLGLVLRARFRRRWRAWLSLSVLVALVSGLVLAGVVTARRTATAFARYEAAHGYDAFLVSEAPIRGLAVLPGVSSAMLLRAVGAGAPTCACSRPINPSYFSVFELAPQDLSRVVKLVAGRMPDQADPHQVLASFTLQQVGVHLGSVIHVPLYAASQRKAALSGASVQPHGGTVALRVVGIEAAEAEFPGTLGTPGYDVYTTRAFARTVNPQAVVLPVYYVRLRHGSASLPRFESQAQALGALDVLDLGTQASVAGSSIHPQAVGWWILTGLAALAGVIVVAQALARQAAIEAGADAGILSALGFTQRQLVLLAIAATLIITVAGVTGGVVLAFALSPLTPVGEARLADPSAGFVFDGFILLPGAAVAAVVMLALGLWPAIRASRARLPLQAAPVPHSSRIVGLLAGTGASPSALIGVRHALERGRGGTAVPVGPALLGSVLAVTALCATAVFGASLTRLTSTPALYGQPFNLTFGTSSPGGGARLGHLLPGLERDRAISDITVGVGGDVSIDGRTVGAVAGQSLRGRLLLTTISGHPPDAADELTLGATTERQLGTHVGAMVRVTVPTPGGGARTSSYRVAGTAVFPPDVGTAGLGTGAVLTLGGLLGSSCAPGPAYEACLLRAVFDSGGGTILVRTAPGPRGRAALSRLARDHPSQVEFPVTPANLVNFGEAVNFPLIFGVVLTLYGIATLLHLLTVSVTRRRQEMGLLKTLGFIRREVAFCVSWQATTVALTGIMIGVPAGIAAGRFIWRAFATNLGVPPAPVVVAWVITAIALGTLITANTLAAGPALAATRSRPASLLRTE